MRLCRPFLGLDAVRSLPLAAALLAALAASCGLNVGGLPSGAEGTPGATGSGGASGGSVATGAGGTAQGPAGPSVSSVTTGASSAGGVVAYRWNSYDVVEDTTTPEVFVVDAKQMQKATIKSYRGISVDDSRNTSDLTIRKSGGAPGNPFEDLNWYYAPSAGDYPYIGKSQKMRMDDPVGSQGPMPPIALDLQLHAPLEQDVFVYAAFVVPLAGHYVLSDVAAHRVLTTGDRTTLQVYLKKGSAPSEKIGTQLKASKKQEWQLETFMLDPQPLSVGDQILFEVGADGDNGDGDALEVAWTIEATVP